ncbi:hypothetical protein QBC44DRAFT_64095 [Cladorrhinum sp. PSN332]|nr:hypothetical protein QBC44DRAFT_64095 [Cladorrhinum sp. PSN332]
MAAPTPTTTYTRSQIVPLTTTFIPPPDCSSNLLIRYGSSVFEANLVTSGAAASRCYPPGFRSVTFSPGICPSGWTGAFAMTLGMQPTESRNICCPAGYTAHPSYVQEVGYLSCSSTSVNLNGIAMNYITSGSFGTTVTSGTFISIFVWHEGFAVQWRDGDFATSSLSSPTATTSSTATPTPSDSSQGDSGLSTGAKAGIGIGAALGSILLLLVAFLLWRRRRPPPSQVESPEYYQPYAAGPQAETKPKGLGAGGTHVREVSTTNGRPLVTPELDSARLGTPDAGFRTTVNAGGYTSRGPPSWSSAPPPIDAPYFHQGVNGSNPVIPQAGLGYAADPGYTPTSAQTSTTVGASSGDYTPGFQGQPAGSSSNWNQAQFSPPPPPTQSGSGSHAYTSIQQLEEEEARLQARKRTLMEMRQLEEEEERIRVMKERLRGSGV